jgi:hypothetical protein
MHFWQTRGTLAIACINRRVALADERSGSQNGSVFAPDYRNGLREELVEAARGDKRIAGSSS